MKKIKKIASILLALMMIISINSIGFGVDAKEKTTVPTADKELTSSASDFAVGNSISYKLTATLPSNYSLYGTYILIFHDTMGSGLTFTKSSVKVYVDDTLVKSGYSVVTDTTDNCTFEVQINDTNALKDSSGNTITVTSDSVIYVTYSCILNGSATTGTEGNSNSMYLEYSYDATLSGSGSSGSVSGGSSSSGDDDDSSSSSSTSGSSGSASSGSDDDDDSGSSSSGSVSGGSSSGSDDDDSSSSTSGSSGSSSSGSDDEDSSSSSSGSGSGSSTSGSGSSGSDDTSGSGSSTSGDGSSSGDSSDTSGSGSSTSGDGSSSDDGSTTSGSGTSGSGTSGSGTSTGTTTGTSTGTSTTPTTVVTIYTYKVVINKVDENGNELEGAGFTLYKYDESQEKYVAVGDELTGVTTFEFSGISSGKYKLVETTTPKGYNSIDPVEFEIVATYNEDGTVTLRVIDEDGNDVEGFTIDSTTISTDVVNNEGLVLPRMGGAGTTAMCVTGAILMIGAMAFYVLKRRTSVA